MAYIPRSPRPAPASPLPDSGRTDPLYWDAVRFLVARGRVGPGGLVRRFKIGRTRALFLLLAMRDHCVTHPWGHRGVYRAWALAWPWLQVVGSHADAPGSPTEYRMYLSGHPAFAQVPGWRAVA